MLLVLFILLMVISYLVMNLMLLIRMGLENSKRHNQKVLRQKVHLVAAKV